MKNQKLRSNLERLANWLVAHDAQTGSTGRITLPFDKRVLAARLGMAPEVLSRSMAALGPYRVTVSGPQVQIGDRDALTKLAQPSIATDAPAN
ncbi:MAG: helix-turn-helix domain-containing protein [Bosea sp. (in: a-proteobacteria)]